VTGIRTVDNCLPPFLVEVWTRCLQSPATVYILFTLLMLALLSLTVGWWTRTSTLLAWVLTVSFLNRLPWVTNGGDNQFRLALFYLLFSPSGITWSLDARRAVPGPGQPPLIPP